MQTVILNLSLAVSTDGSNSENTKFLMGLETFSALLGGKNIIFYKDKKCRSIAFVKVTGLKNFQNRMKGTCIFKGHEKVCDILTVCPRQDKENNVDKNDSCPPPAILK